MNESPESSELSEPRVQSCVSSTLGEAYASDRTGSELSESRHQPQAAFKTFRCARILPARIELMHMIAKGQMKFSRATHPSAADQFYDLARRSILTAAKPAIPHAIPTTRNENLSGATRAGAHPTPPQSHPRNRRRDTFNSTAARITTSYHLSSVSFFVVNLYVW